MSKSTEIYIDTLCSALDEHMYWLEKKLSVTKTIKRIIQNYPSLAKDCAMFLDGKMSALDFSSVVHSTTEGRIQHEVIFLLSSFIDLKIFPYGKRNLKNFIADSIDLRSMLDRSWSRHDSLDDPDVDIDVD